MFNHGPHGKGPVGRPRCHNSATHSGFCIPAEQKTWHPEGPFTSTNTDKLDLTMALVVQPSRPSVVGGVAKYSVKPKKKFYGCRKFRGSTVII